MSKLKTPEWVLEGYDGEADYLKSKGLDKKKKTDKIFKIKECPKCRSNDVGVVLTGEEGKGSNGWECHKCSWKGKNIIEKELNEDEFLEYLDDRGEGVS